MFNGTSYCMARKSRVKIDYIRKIILVYFLYRAFLSSPFVRELSSVKQENKMIRVRFICVVFDLCKYLFLYIRMNI